MWEFAKGILISQAFKGTVYWLQRNLDDIWKVCFIKGCETWWVGVRNNGHTPWATPLSHTPPGPHTP